jgi:hypothetical protein
MALKFDHEKPKIVEASTSTTTYEMTEMNAPSRNWSTRDLPKLVISLLKKKKQMLLFIVHV